jgi:transposase, IS5 family
MIKKKERGFFDEQYRLEHLSKKTDPLEQLDSIINFEGFRSIINTAFKETDKSKGGRPSFDRVMMFKILVLKAMYNLSDDNLEYQILDRLSFMRFLKLTLADQVPDSKTIWVFRDTLKEHDIYDQLFVFFREKLRTANLILNDGTIVDAQIVEVPRQRNTREENQQIKEDEVPEEWTKHPKMLCQKDVDARWLKKNDVNYYGYKNHIKIDNGSKIITEYQVTTASIHDSEALKCLLDRSDRGKPFYGDSAYVGEACEKLIKKFKMKNHVIQKAYRNKPLTEEQKQTNHKNSKVRVRVEHIFGAMSMKMKTRMRLCAIGLDRIASQIVMRNIVYNMLRAVFLIKSKAEPILAKL